MQGKVQKVEAREQSKNNKKQTNNNKKKHRKLSNQPKLTLQSWGPALYQVLCSA